MPTIDNKIVQMTFDNQQFERGVAESLKSLEALKKGLELDKAVDSLSNLEKTANSFDISGIAKGVEQVADKFTFLGRVAQNVYDDIYRAGKQAISGMINTITEMPRVGEQKYETKNKAVQMIKAALPEKSLEDVENVLARLNEYTDLTSYDFATMAKSIGKFTAAGIDLDVAERAMEGIANQTAAAGGEISTANIAMYNFSQALSAGAVKMIDWKSIENQNLATKEFKEQIIQTAIELGRLSKVQDNVGRTAKGTEVSYLSFRETLAQGWFDNDVLIGVLEKYADRESEVGERAFKAAREAITFQQAVDAVKDALSTGWMNSWQLLIGNLDEATEFLTTASDAVIDFLAIFSDYRNEVLEGWHNGVALTNEENAEVISGYTLAVETLGYAWEIVTGFVRMAADAFADVFGLMDARGLVSITKQIHDSVKNARDIFGAYEETVRRTEQVTKEAVTATREWSGALSSGTKGSQSEVKKMQELFIQLNKDTDTFGDKFKDVVLTNFGADGIFGKETEEAVKAFQKAVGIDITGIFDEDTQKKLDEYLTPELNTDSVREWAGDLKKGARDADVKSMQRLFMVLNSDTERFGDKFKDVVLTNFGADGIFGKETEAAVKAFQKAMELPETGIFDKQTQEALDKVLYPEGKKETVYQTVEETIYRINPGLVKFRSIVKGVLSVVRVGVNLGKAALSVIGSVAKAIMPVVNGAFTLVAGVADIVSVALDFVSAFNLAGAALSVFDFILTPVANALSTFGGFLASIGEGFSTIAGLVRQGLGLDEIREELEKNPDANGGALMIYNLFVRLQGIIETITPYVETAKAVLVSLFATAYSWISGKLKSAFNNVKSIIDAFKKGGFENAFGRVIRLLSKSKIGSKFVGPLLKLKSGIKKIVEGVSGFGAAVIDIFTKLRKGMSLEEIFNDLMRNPEKNRTAIGIVNFLTRLSNAFNTIKNTAKDFKNALAPALESVWTKVKGFGTNIWNGLVDFFTPEEGKTFFESIGDKISGWAESAWANIVEFFVPGEDGKGLLDHINECIATISTTLEAKKTEIVTWWGTFSQNPIVTTATGFLSSIWSGIIDWLVPGRNGSEMSQYVDENIENIKGTFGNSHSGIGSWWKGIISNPIITKIVDWAESAWANAVEWFLPGKDGRSVIDHIQWGILIMKYRFIALKYKIKSIWNKLKQNPVIGAITGWAESIWNGIVTFFDPTVEDKDVGSYISNRLSKIRDKIKEAWGNVTGWFSNLRSENPVIDTIAGGIESAWGKIIEVITSVYEKATEIVTQNPETGKSPLQTFLDNAASIFDPIANLFTGFAGSISGGWNTIKSAFAEVAEKGGVFSWIKNVLTGFGQSMEDFDLTEFLSQANALMTAGVVAFALTKIATIFGGWTNIGKNLVSGLSDGKFSFFESGNGKISNTILKTGLGILSIGAAVMLVVQAVQQMNSMAKHTSAEDMKETIQLIISVFTGIAGLEAVAVVGAKFGKTSFSLGGALSVAAAVWIIVDAIKRINDYTKNLTPNQLENLKKTMGLIGALVGAFTVVEAGVSSFTKNTWGALSSGAGAVGIAIAIEIIIDAISRLAKVNEDNNFNDIWGVIGQISTLIGALGVIEAGVGAFTKNSFGAISSGGGAIGMALAIEIIIDAIARLANVNTSNSFEDIWGVIGQISLLVGVINGSEGLIGALTKNGWGAVGMFAAAANSVAMGWALETIITSLSNGLVKIQESGISKGKINAFNGYLTGIVAIIKGVETLDGIMASATKGISAIGTGASGIATAASGWGIGEMVDSLGSALAKIKDVPTETIQAFMSYLEGIIALMEGLVTVGGLVGVAQLFGSFSLDQMVKVFDQLTIVAYNSAGRLSYFDTKMSNVDLERLPTTATKISEMAGILSSITNYKTAASVLDTIGGSLALYGGNIAGLNFNSENPIDSDTLRKAFEALAGAIPEDSELFDTVAFDPDAGQDQRVTKMAVAIENLGTSLSDYATKIGGINQDDVATANDVLQTVSNLKINAQGGLWQLIAGSKNLGNFAANLGDIGNGLAQFAEKITDENGNGIFKNVEIEDVMYPIKVLGKISKDIPETGGIFQFFSGSADLKKFGEQLAGFGEQLSIFAGYVDDFNGEDSSVKSAIDTLDRLVQISTLLDGMNLSDGGNLEALRAAFVHFFTNLEGDLGESGIWTESSLTDYAAAATSVLTSMATGITENITVLTDAIDNALVSVSTSAGSEDKKTWWTDIGYNIAAGIAEGINNGAWRSKLAAYNLAAATYRVVKDFFGIASPSKEFAWLGQMSDEGLAQGLSQYSHVVESASEDVAQATLDGYDTGILNSISDTPVIRPVLDLSDVTSGAATIGGMFGNYNVGVTSSGIATRIASEGTLSIGGSGAQDLVGAVSDLNDRVDQLTYAISNMKVVTETGALVGAISTQMDIQLGENEFYDSRGI